MKVLCKLTLTTFFSLLSLLAITLNAQVTCRATAPGQVADGQPFVYEVELNEKPSRINSVSFSNFKLLNGPSTGSSTSIQMSGGKTVRTSSYTYSYTLAPKTKGSFTIPAAVFTVDGKQVKSNAVKVKVVEASEQQRQAQQQSGINFNEKEVLLRATASKTNPYVGEQVVVTYKLYVPPTANGGFQITNVNSPSQPNVWAYDLGDPSGEAERSSQTINGINYQVFQIKESAIFPQRSGELTISPLEVGFLCRVISQQRSRSFWGFSNQQSQDFELDLKSNKINLNVKALPESEKHEDFTGLVGNFSLNAQLSRSALSANDATNLVVTISGSGNLQHVSPLMFNFPPDFDVADPKITDKINTKGTSVSGSRTFEYVIIPRNGGEFEIEPATFSFFNNNTKKYETLSTDHFTLNVDGSTADPTITSNTSNQKNIKIIGNDIRFIKTASAPFVKLEQTPFFASISYYSFLLLPFILLVLFVIIWRNRIEKYSNAAYVNNKKARKRAVNCLKKANQFLQKNEKDAFYVEVSRALWGYISNKYHIPLAQLSMETVETTFSEKEISEQTTEHLIKTLQNCEFYRFAPGDSTANMQEMYKEALAFILENEAIKSRK